MRSDAGRVCRCAVLMAARARLTGGTTGICITASHNPVQDNGVKLADPGGEMLAMSWEVRVAIAERSQNARRVRHMRFRRGAVSRFRCFGALRNETGRHFLR